MNVHCFYHRADLDGHCCGAIVRHWCEIHGHTYTPHGVNYGDTDIPFLTAAAPDMQDSAIICDFTPEGNSLEIMTDMSEAYGMFCWIDHHATAIDKTGPDAGSKFMGLRNTGVAACVLTWKFLFPDKPVPYAVLLIGQYDIFARTGHEVWAPWETIVLPFQYALKLYRTNPDGTDKENLWNVLLDKNERLPMPFFKAMIQQGETCLLMKNMENARTPAYDCDFEGLLCCAANARGNSLVLDAYARPEHHLRILWSYDRGVYRVHLYENGHPDLHCGQIAQAYGGGGHKGAAGFELPANVSPLSVIKPVETPLIQKEGGNHDEK